MFGLHSTLGDERTVVAALLTGLAMSFFGNGVVSWGYSLFAGEEAAAALPWSFQANDESSYVLAVLAALVAYLGVALVTARGARPVAAE
jgi:hypothetical protein